MARFALSDESDHSAPVWIVAFLTLTYTTLSLCLRTWVKVRMLGVDDALAAVAQFLAYGNAGSVLFALQRGLARHLPESTGGNGLELVKAVQASQVFYLLALAAAKMTIVLFLQRVFERANEGRAILLCNLAIGLVCLWGAGSSIAVTVGCAPEHYQMPALAKSCTGAATRWLIVTLLDCSSEVLIVLLAVYLVSDLQMGTSDKMSVCVAFAWRLGLVILGTLHYTSYRNMLQSERPSVAISRIVIWEQVSICYSLMSVTWPFSKQWIRSFDTSRLVVVTTYGSGPATEASAPVPQSRMHARWAGLSLTRRSWNDVSVGHPSLVYNTGRAKNIGSSGSQEMIIRRDDEIEVTFERR